MKLRLTELLTIGTMVAAAPALAQTYTVEDLGALPGTSESEGVALNDLGQACGVCVSNGYFATLFSDGKALALGGLVSGDTTYAEAIDNSGVVVGYETFKGTSLNHALLWRNGTVQDITATSLFPGGATATAIIKQSGVVVGAGTTSSGASHIFEYANGQTVDLGPKNANASPFAINDSGEMLVYYQTSANPNGQAIFSNGTFTLLNAPANASVTANAINNSGVVVGGITYNTNTAVPHAALYSNGVWTDLGVLPGATRGTVAYSINSAGQILAIAAYQAIYHPFRPAKTVPCILRNGVWVDLNTLIPANSGFNLSRPVPVSGLNDAGQILVNTKNATGTTFEHTVLLTPK
jgi:probable HAF family extracellular repeat protein